MSAPVPDEEWADCRWWRKEQSEKMGRSKVQSGDLDCWEQAADPSPRAPIRPSPSPDTSVGRALWRRALLWTT